jgi:hypothetical protein
LTDHASEFRRCLLTLDVAGIMAIHAHVSPHLPSMSVRDALCSLHMARVDAKSIPKKLRTYSEAWLHERGFQKIDGQWFKGIFEQGIVEAVGISSCAAPGVVLPFNRKVVQYMQCALLDAMAKGVTEAPMHKEVIMKARDKVRFKAARI